MDGLSFLKLIYRTQESLRFVNPVCLLAAAIKTSWAQPGRNKHQKRSGMREVHPASYFRTKNSAARQSSIRVAEEVFRRAGRVYQYSRTTGGGT